jgi:hypothetical protein
MDEPPVPIVCTLSPNQMGERLDEFSELFGNHLLSVTRPAAHRTRWVLRAADGVEAATRDLLVREQQCCAFFTFGVERIGDTLVVEATVPAGAELALDGLTSIARRAAPRAFA